MVDLLKTGSDWLADQQNLFASQSVVYKRGANVVVLQAMLAKQESVIEEESAFVTARSRDFIFIAAHLILNGVVELPQRDDRITWNGNEYEVVPIDGEDIWHWADHYEKQYRVHTQEVKAG